MKAALSLKKDPERSVKEICEIVGISRNTYYKYTGTGATSKARDKIQKSGETFEQDKRGGS